MTALGRARAPARSQPSGRLLRLGWPWSLIGLAALHGALTTGLAGALLNGGITTLLYGLLSACLALGSPERPWHLRAVLFSALLGAVAMLAGGCVGAGAPDARTDVTSAITSRQP